MSRVSLIEQLYIKKKSALEFNYDNLGAPPIRMLFTQEDINELYRIATSLKYNGNINKKYKLIDEVMNRRGFRKAHAGTNRVVYNFLEDTSFVAKVAVDRVGLKDTPAEFKNQQFLKPFCCKIFEVDPSGVIGFVERVNPITSIHEFLSVSDDIFNLITTKIIGKYVLDDIGASRYMNYGIRCNSNGYTFGPVILDFPYAYELDGAKIICQRPMETPFGRMPCGGEIDYDNAFDNLICTRCGKHYKARELSSDKQQNNIIFKGGNKLMRRARIMRGDKVYKDGVAESHTYVTKKEYEAFNSKTVEPDSNGNVVIDKVIFNKPRKKQKPNMYGKYTPLMVDTFANNNINNIHIGNKNDGFSKTVVIDDEVDAKEDTRFNGININNIKPEDPNNEKFVDDLPTKSEDINSDEEETAEDIANRLFSNTSTEETEETDELAEAEDEDNNEGEGNEMINDHNPVLDTDEYFNSLLRATYKTLTGKDDIDNPDVFNYFSDRMHNILDMYKDNQNEDFGDPVTLFYDSFEEELSDIIKDYDQGNMEEY